MLKALVGVVIEVADLEASALDFERLLGVAPRSPGRRVGSSRAIVFTLGNTKLELRRIASPDGERAASSAMASPARSPASPPVEGIAGLRFAFEPSSGRDFEAGPIASPSVSVELVPPDDADGRGEPDELAGRDAFDERDEATGHERRSRLLGLDHVVVATGDPERARRFFGEALGLRLALDRTFPERGLRLLFFRLAGITIEVASTLARDEGPAPDPVGPSPGQDAFHGLALKVEGIDALHARLTASGFAVSPVRDGFKPGTRVFGSRTPVHGVPLLWIEHPLRPGW
jgi:catechol 2,3-dioxygenase-like lactoylglutathione lyase family enzyme